MKSVRVEKGRLVEALTANRSKHVEEYTAALEGYYKQAEAEVKKLAKRIKDRSEGGHLYVNLVKPESYEEQYDTALEMLEWSQDESIEVSQQEFRQYIQDEWAWKQSFSTTNSTYIA